MLRSLHTASHMIQSLTLSLTICQAQKDLWNKLMGQTLKYKVKMTQKQLTILLLNKLKQNCLSTLGINKYLKFEVWEDDQRSKICRKLLSYKIGNAISEEKSARRAFMKKIDYLKRRWGHHSIIMQKFLVFMQS